MLKATLVLASCLWRRFEQNMRHVRAAELRLSNARRRKPGAVS